jgi:hypothetical protein
MPLTSVLNARRRATTANTATVAIGASGAICVYASAATDVVVDLTAVIAPGGAGVEPVEPQRLVDTRPGAAQRLDVPQQRVGPAGLTVDVGPVLNGRAADAVSVNLTAVSPTAAGFLSLLPGPCSGAVPSTSSLNVQAGRDVAVSSIVRVDDGRFCVFSDVDTDVVVDLQALHTDGGDQVTPIAPLRVFDSRSGAQRVPAGVELRISGAVPSFAGAAVVNLTAVDAVAPGYLSLAPCGAPPGASNVNFGPVAPTANLAVVAAGSTGDICISASVDTHVVVDVEAWIG